MTSDGIRPGRFVEKLSKGISTRLCQIHFVLTHDSVVKLSNSNVDPCRFGRAVTRECNAWLTSLGLSGFETMVGESKATGSRVCRVKQSSNGYPSKV